MTRRTQVSYGSIERFYDTDHGITRLVKKRYVIATEGTVDCYTKRGSWDYVPYDWPETDAASRLDERRHG